MKVLFDHSSPFFLAHGGFQIQIEQTKAALEAVGVEVEFVRWWDEGQRGDIIHFFGRPTGAYVELAQQKNFRVVQSELLTGLGSRSATARVFQKALIRIAMNVLPPAFTSKLGWDAYAKADACIANTPWEGQLMVEMFSAPPERVHCVPNGVEQVFLQSNSVERGGWLVCTATIAERKRTLELAEAAVQSKVPTWIIGKPYSAADPYAGRFLDFAKQHPSLVRYEGAISDRAKLAQVYRQARGFVLLSTMETRSLAAEEAAACECPLLLSDLPWARCVFGQNASYCPVTRSTGRTASILRRFYDEAPRLPVPPKPKTWLEVARIFQAVYETALKTSR